MIKWWRWRDLKSNGAVSVFWILPLSEEKRCPASLHPWNETARSGVFRYGMPIQKRYTKRTGFIMPTGGAGVARNGLVSIGIISPSEVKKRSKPSPTAPSARPARRMALKPTAGSFAGPLKWPTEAHVWCAWSVYASRSDAERGRAIVFLARREGVNDATVFGLGFSTPLCQITA